MVLIITNEADFSTNIVMNWLRFYNIDFIRVNDNDDLGISFCSGDILFESKDFKFKLTDVKGVWYRRGFLKITIDKINDTKIDEFRRQELLKIKEFIYYKLSLLPNINSYENSEVNKLIVNSIANEVGLIVPKDILVSNKVDLFNQSKEFKLATKSITGSSMFFYEDFYFVGYTSLVEDIKEISDNFFPSLAQNYVEKKYELRIFFLHNNFWTMAIFSQKDKKTEVDFRNYNDEVPNRNVAFNLPQDIKDKLSLLMSKIKLNSGSIDMIVTPNNEYVFLEVNPIGQFGMVSQPCNFYLHKEIAKFFKD